MMSSWAAADAISLRSPPFFVPNLGTYLHPSAEPCFVLIDSQKLSADQAPGAAVVGVPLTTPTNVNDDPPLLLALALHATVARCKDTSEVDTKPPASKRTKQDPDVAPAYNHNYEVTVNWWPLVRSHKFLRQELVPYDRERKENYSARIPEAVQSNSSSTINPDAIVDVAFVLHPSEVDERGCRIEGIWNAFVAEHRWMVGSRELSNIPRCLLSRVGSLSSFSSRCLDISLRVGNALGEVFTAYDSYQMSSGSSKIEYVDEAQWRWLLRCLNCEPLQETTRCLREERFEYILRRKQELWETEEVKRTSPLLEVVRINTAQKLGRLQSVVGDHVGIGICHCGFAPSRGGLSKYGRSNILSLKEKPYLDGWIDLIFDTDRSCVSVCSTYTSKMNNTSLTKIVREVEEEYTQNEESSLRRDGCSFGINAGDSFFLQVNSPYSMNIMSLDESTGVAIARVADVSIDEYKEDFDMRLFRDFTPSSEREVHSFASRDKKIATGDERMIAVHKMGGCLKQHEQATGNEEDALIYRIGYEFTSFTMDDKIIKNRVSQKNSDGSILVEKKGEEGGRDTCRFESAKELHDYITKCREF